LRMMCPSCRVAGALKSGFISVVGGYIFGHVYYKLKARGIVSSYKKKLDKLKKAYDTKNEQLRLEFGSTIQVSKWSGVVQGRPVSLTGARGLAVGAVSNLPPLAHTPGQSLDIHADAVDGMIEQLEQILQHPDTDPSKRKLAEFKMPDSNNDNLISRQEVCTYVRHVVRPHRPPAAINSLSYRLLQRPRWVWVLEPIRLLMSCLGAHVPQFNTYLKSYFAAHPELREMEFPTFDDFDMDHNGLVSFTEWKEFVANLGASLV
jgi:hypothetical protein